jgi:DNA-binding MarR family transcriptional regulator
MTRIIDRLVEKGLVTRGPAPGDGRSNLVSLTPEGRRMVSSIRNQRNAWLAVQLRDLPPAEVEDLRLGITALEKILRNG